MVANVSRRRLSFSLSTMFVGLTLACAAGGWVGYQLNWIRQRHIAATNRGVSLAGEVLPAPFPLGMFGERGRAVVLVWGFADVDEIRRLFPEAEYIQAMPASVPVEMDR